MKNGQQLLIRLISKQSVYLAQHFTPESETNYSCMKYGFLEKKSNPDM